MIDKCNICKIFYIVKFKKKWEVIEDVKKFDSLFISQ